MLIFFANPFKICIKSFYCVTKLNFFFILWLNISVADPGCLSRIPDPDFYPSRIPDLGSRISDPGSRIPDPKTATKERGEKKFDVIATNFTNLNII
jgi:hypothetical protein